jgi:hypothetical protein
MIAVNLSDLIKDEIFALMMIEPITKNRKIIDIEKGRIDGKALILECSNERALAIRDIARNKYTKSEMRFYKGKERI